MNIMVPIDFSASAQYALETAVSFAKNNAVIHLVHILEPLNRGKANFLKDEMIQKEMDQGKENALTLMHALTNSHPGPQYKIHIVAGNVIDILKVYADEENIDLIIMGSHGDGEPSRVSIGSNAQKVVRQINRKILVVKQAFQSTELNEVVFASNFDIQERECFRQFRDFILPFSPKVHLVYISTNLFFGLPSSVIKGIMKEAEKEFAPLTVESHYFKDYTVEEGIERIAKKLGANMIGISNHSKHALKRMISGSNVEALVNHSSIPILSIDYPKTKELSSVDD